MADYYDIHLVTIADSDIVRVAPGALIQIFASGSETPYAEVITDAKGRWSIASLPTGKYDIRIHGQFIASFHHVKADHTHQPDLPWVFTKGGSITADQDEVNTMPVFGTGSAGVLEYVMVCAESADAVGDVTVHLLRGAKSGASALTVASNSVWSHQINPGAAEKRYLHEDNNPGVSLAADECLTLGINHTANGVEGLTVLAIFRPE